MATFITLVIWVNVARLVVVLAMIACDACPFERTVTNRSLVASLGWIGLAIAVLGGAL